MSGNGVMYRIINLVMILWSQKISVKCNCDVDCNDEGFLGRAATDLFQDKSGEKKVNQRLIFVFGI